MIGPGSFPCRIPGFRRSGERDGFALLAVLWVLVALAALGLVAQLAARESVAAARNREDLARAAWRAEGCAERARAAVSAALRAARMEGPGGQSWNRLPATVAASPLTEGCDLTLHAAGASLDANRVDPETLHRLFDAMGIAPATADSLTDALLDWRDADPDPRPFGAEATAYRQAGRTPPRDGPLADPAELLLVRGFDRVAGIDSLLGVEGGLIPVGQAPIPVLAALPGVTPQFLARVAELRLRGEPIPEAVLAGASPRGDLGALTTPSPEAWVVTARAREGAPPVTAVVELRLVRAGERAAITRRRDRVE